MPLSLQGVGEADKLLVVRPLHGLTEQRG